MLFTLGIGSAWAAEYELVTSAPSDWSGEYLVVYKTGCFNGNLTSTFDKSAPVEVSVSNNKITLDEKYAMVIAKQGSAYSLKTASGYYIGRESSNSNGMDSGSTWNDKYAISLTWNLTDKTIQIAGKGGKCLGLNSTTWRFYASSNAYVNLSLYKKVDQSGGGEETEPTPRYTVKWYTAVGTSTDVTLDEGAAIAKPATDPEMSGYKFMGWTDQCSVAADGVGFTPLTDFGTADADKEFYAVFAEATTSGGGSSNYEKVTSNLADWAGDYLIAYNNATFADGRTGGTSGMGAQNKKVDLSSNISNNAIPASVGDQYNVTLEAVSGGYVLKTKDGNYNYQSSNANGLATTKTIATAAPYAINVTFTSENDIKLALTGSAEGAVFRYNTQGYFRFYKNGGQSAVYLYKKTSGGGSTTTYSNYITTCSGATVAENLTDAQFAWSAATAEATMGATNTFPTLTNTVPVSVTYESSNTSTATIAADGTITLVAPGTTTISAKFAGGEVSGTTYAAKTVTYTLTVKKAPLAPITGGVIDILNQEWTGKTTSSYGDVTEKTAENTGHSNAKYVAQCAGDKSSIQLRSNNSNSGVVSTVSGGIVKRVEVEWQNETSSGRVLQIYGSNTAYTAATDLYDDAKKGTLLGEVTMGGDETVVDYTQWTGDYKYIGFRSKSGAMYLTTVTITWLPTISKVTIADPIENGSVSVAGAADLNSVAAGTVLTLTATPATDYKFSAYDVYKTDDATVKVTVTDGKFIMPEYDLTISATFVPVKTLTNIEITTPATQTTFWQGETFNSTGLEVTAHFDGAADEVVTPTVTGSTATAGTQTVTVSYTEGTVTKSTSYEITVKAIPNTKETAYSVADAYDIIDKLTTAEGVFISGTISQVDSYNSTYKSITYWISADGTTTKQLQAYSGKGLESADFAAKTDLTVGDKVIVCGDLKKYGSTYEFDKNNYLAEHTPTTKDPAGLVYATTEYTANVGEAFATPILTNPNNLTVTYSTSDASKATVDAATGAVTILAVGKVTITASTTGDATHDAGTASYTITISDPALAIATLPFTYNSGKAAIETTAGITQSGLGSDYTAAGVPPLKFDTEGDNVIVHYDQQAGEFSFVLKQNGQNAGTFTVYESANGEDYTPVWTGGDLGNAKSETITPTLAAASRYVKFEYTTKGNSTNYGLGSISIQKPDLRQEAGIAWSAETTTITIGDAFTAPTLSNPNGLTLTCTSDNDALATVTNAGVITLKSGVTGKAVITATFAANENYKGAEVTTTIYVNPKTDNVVILAKYNGQWYAMMAEYVTDKTDRLAALPVNYVGGKLYNVSEEDKAAITWKLSVIGGNATFQNGTNYLTGSTSTTLSLNETAFDWAFDGSLYLSDSDSRTFIYHKDGYFRNYAKGNPENYPDTYSTLPLVTAPVYATGDAYGRSVNLGEDGYRYGTICLPFGSSNYTGAQFFECVGKEEGKVYIASVNTLVAGTPYIFLASATEVAVYGDGTTAATPGSKNGLVGTFTNDTEVAIGNYILKDNAICEVAATCWVNAYRAYIVMEDIVGDAPQQMPGRRYIGMSVQGENEVTGFENIQLPNTNSQKLIINGQLIIIRDGEKYNAQGQKL